MSKNIWHPITITITLVFYARAKLVLFFEPLMPACADFQRPLRPRGNSDRNEKALKVLLLETNKILLLVLVLSISV